MPTFSTSIVTAEEFYATMHNNRHIKILDIYTGYDTMRIPIEGGTEEINIPQWEIFQEDINVHNALLELDEKADAEADMADDRAL